MYEGWHAQTWHPEFETKREEFSFGFLQRCEFKKYLTADFWSAFSIWKKYTRFGLPSGKGWRDEPSAMLEVLEVFDDLRESLDLLSREEEKRRLAGNRRT